MQRQNAIIIVTVLALLGVGSWWLKQPRGIHRSSVAVEARSAFQRICPRPQWWDRVQAPRVKTLSELSAYWQRQDRTPEQFFKTAYQAIEEYPDDVDLVVQAIALMYYGDPSYPHMIALQELVIQHYFSYQTSLVNYTGKSGDTVADVVENLSTLYNRHHRYEDAINLVERLLSERRAEVNDQLLELITLEYAEALHGAGRVEDAKAALRDAIDTYHGDWELRLKKLLASYEGQ